LARRAREARGGGGFLRRGYNLEEHAIIVIQKFRYRIANLVGGDFQVVGQIRIE